MSIFPLKLPSVGSVAGFAFAMPEQLGLAAQTHADPSQRATRWRMETTAH